MSKWPVLPVMQCDSGCGECCGPANCNETEYANIKSYIVQHGITPQRQGFDLCPFYHGTCQIYPVRPYICRLFGHSVDLVCCKGYNTNINPERERKLTDEYMERGMPDRMLHEFAYSLDEIKDLATQYFEEPECPQPPTP